MSIKNTKSFLPSNFQSPYSLLVVVFAQLILLAINLISYSLIQSEIATDLNESFLGLPYSQEQAWFLLFAIELILMVFMTFVALKHLFKKHQINYWWNLPILIFNILVLWFITWSASFILPSSVVSWILRPEYFLYCQFALLMPAVFYSLSILASFEQQRMRKEIDLASSAGLSFLLPVFVYSFFVLLGQLNWFRLSKHFPDFWTAAFTILSIFILILITLLTLFAVMRFVMVLHILTQEKGKLVQTIVVAIFALLLPIGGLILNRYIPFPVNLQSEGVYILTIFNAIFLLLPVFQKPVLDRIIWVCQAVCLPFSLYFFLVFMPFMPLALLAIIFVGAGFLIFAPIALFIIHLQKIKIGFDSLWETKKKAVIVFSLSFLLLPLVYSLSALCDKASLNQAISYVYEPNYKKPQMFLGSRFFLKRSLKRLEDFKDGIYLPFLSPYYNWLVFDGLTLPDSKIQYIKLFFFGEDPFQKETKKENLFFSSSNNFRQSNRSMNSSNSLLPPTAENSSNINSLKLSYELLESSPAEKQETSYQRSVIKFKVSNTSNLDLEYRTRLELPAGVFVSGLWLYINDKKQKGGIFEKKSANWVYQMATSQRRDPAILSYIDSGLLDFRLFPCLSKKERVFELEFLYPVGQSENIKFANQEIKLSKKIETKKKNYFYEGSNFIYLSDKETLKSFKRKPYLHLIIENSKNSDLSNLKNKFQIIKSKFPEAKDVVVSFANYEYTKEGISKPIQINEFEKQLADPKSYISLQVKSLQSKGGFAQDRFIKLAILEQLQFVKNCNFAEADWGFNYYPIIVVVKTSKQAELKDTEYSLNYFKDFLPDYSAFHLVDYDGVFHSFNLDGSALYKLPGAVPVIAFCQPSNTNEINTTIIPENESKVFLQKNLQKIGELKLFDSEQLQFISVPSFERITESGNSYTQTLNLWQEFDELVRNPSLSEQIFRQLVQKSKKLGAMLPITSYIVLENKAQEEALKRKETQKLNNKAALEIMEADEPPFWIVLMLALVFVSSRRKRTNAFENK
jgi:hypothetical protein